MPLSKKDLTNMGVVIDNKLSPVKKDVKKIKKDVSIMLDVLDRKDGELSKRITKIENNPHLSSFN